jgi:hypothetical protein
MAGHHRGFATRRNPVTRWRHDGNSPLAAGNALS